MENKEIVEQRKTDKFLLKKTNVDNEIGFEFNLSPLKWVGIVFAITAVFLPFLLSIIFRIIFNETEFKNLNLGPILFLTNFVLLLLGMLYIIKVLSLKKFVESGAVGFYFFVFFPDLAGLITTIFIGAMTIDEQAGNLIRIAVRIITHLISIILIFVLSPSLRLRFKKTVKGNFLIILFVISIAAFVLFLVLNFFFSNIDKLINGEGTSQNQANINEMKSTVWGTVLIFFMTVISAPFIEELACRHGIFSLSGSKWLGFFTSVIYFAGMHVASAGDWNRILVYMAGSIAITLTFLYVRGNVTFTIFLHMLHNLVVFIFSLIAK